MCAAGLAIAGGEKCSANRRAQPPEDSAESFIAARLGPDARLERSLFGTDDPERIWARVQQACPEAVECFAFEVSVGALVGVRLEDGARVAVKIHGDRHPTGYLVWMQGVQAHLAGAGFPCPRPLGARGRATLEEWRDEGEYRDAHEPSVRRVIAGQLAELVRLTRELPLPDGVDPFFPRTAERLWPTPHNVLFDFEATSGGAEWIDEIARVAKPLRHTGLQQEVIGHDDWSVKHFRFDGLRPTVIYDWDSLTVEPEAVLVGQAAATFTYTEHLPVELWPSVAEATAFLDDYEAARGLPFSTGERRAAGASAVWSRAYSSRCVHALGRDTSTMRLQDYVAELL